MSIQQELTLFLNQQGIQSVGFAHLEQEDINLLKPVSYTHLDVYKRQFTIQVYKPCVNKMDIFI